MRTLLLLTLLIMTGCEKEIKKGDVFMFSYNYSSKDPFQDVREDSVMVLEVRNGYILYQHQDEFKIIQHCKENVFRSCLKK